jgi:hypothetical protein
MSLSSGSCRRPSCPGPASPLARQGASAAVPAAVNAPRLAAPGVPALRGKNPVEVLVGHLDTMIPGATGQEQQRPKVVEIEQREDIRRSAIDLLLVERARQWLLEDAC